MTKSALARAMPVANSTVSRWMGGAVPDTATLKRLAEVLECDVSELLSGQSANASRSYKYVITTRGDDVVRESLPSGQPRQPGWETVQMRSIVREIENCALQLPAIPEAQRAFVFERMDRLWEDLKKLCVNLPYQP